MDEEMVFSLSYEQFLQEVEESIQKCDLRKEGSYFPQELNKASDLLAL